MNLYKHQEITVELMKREKRVAVWLEQGLGKTLCAIRAIEELGLQRPVIVCPNYLKYLVQRVPQMVARDAPASHRSEGPRCRDSRGRMAEDNQLRRLPHKCG